MSAVKTKARVQQDVLWLWICGLKFYGRSIGLCSHYASKPLYILANGDGRGGICWNRYVAKVPCLDLHYTVKELCVP
mgnify:FL=1